MRMLTGFMRASPRPEDEFRDLIARRGARLQAACLRITRDPALAEDAVQEALLRAWRARDQFRAEAERDTWLHRIAINAALELVRRRGPMAGVEADASEHDRPGGDDPAQTHLRAAFGADTGAAMAKLTEMERVCFVLKHIEQWTLEEIAAHLGRSINSIKQALFRGVGKLRGELAHWQEDSR
jgi:RNA polymerase sigma-70 factor (ECF subfamily)